MSEASSWIHLDILETYLKSFKISPHHKRQEEPSDLADLTSKQSFTLRYKLINTLSQDVRQIAEILPETVTMTPLITMIRFLLKLVKHCYLNFKTVRMAIRIPFVHDLESSFQNETLRYQHQMSLAISIPLLWCILLAMGIAVFLVSSHCSKALHSFHKGLLGFFWKTLTADHGHFYFLTMCFYLDTQNCQKVLQ